MSCEQPSFVLSAEAAWADDLPNTLLPPDAEIEYTVGELAADLGVTARALRFYESKGLLSPARHEGMRLYRRTDRERLAMILKAKKFGFTLLEIKDMIDAQSGHGAGNALNLSLAKCSDQISLLERQREELDEALAELRGMQGMLAKRDGAR
jgi:DNA-binding transcriptional MerR regulator